MKRFLLPALALGLIGCSNADSESSEVSSVSKKSEFAQFNWNTDSGLRIEKETTEDNIHQDARLDFIHLGETKNGKNLHNLDIEVSSYGKDHDLGQLKEELYDLECKKTYKRILLKKLAKVECESVFSTDQNPEMKFGAPKVNLTMEELSSGKINAKITVDRGFEKTTVEIKQAKYVKPFIY